MNEKRLKEFIEQNMEKPTQEVIRIDSDPLCNTFVDIMFKKGFWEFFNDFFLPLVRNNKPIFVTNKKYDFRHLHSTVKKMRGESSLYNLRPIMGLLNQWKDKESYFDAYSKLIEVLFQEQVITPFGDYLLESDGAHSILPWLNNLNQKTMLAGNNGYRIIPTSLNPLVRASITNNQFLEMYSHSSMVKAGWKPLIYRTDDGRGIRTSLRIKNTPHSFEIDSGGVFENSLLICEAKNMKKFRPKDLRNKLSQLEVLLKQDFFQQDSNLHIYFCIVVNGDIDDVASKYEDIEYPFEIIHMDKTTLPDLPNRFKELKEIKNGVKS